MQQRASTQSSYSRRTLRALRFMMVAPILTCLASHHDPLAMAPRVVSWRMARGMGTTIDLFQMLDANMSADAASWLKLEWPSIS